jgi:hypothetical protein
VGSGASSNRSDVTTQRRVGPAVILCLATAVCALAALLSVRWDGCNTGFRAGAATTWVLLVAAAALWIAAIGVLTVRWEGAKGRVLGIVLLSGAGLLMLGILFGLAASNSGCS